MATYRVRVPEWHDRVYFVTASSEEEAIEKVEEKEASGEWLSREVEFVENLSNESTEAEFINEEDYVDESIYGQL